MLARLAILTVMLSMAVLSSTEAQATPMEVSCYGDCGTGYNALYGNPTCTGTIFTGEDYTAAATPTYPPGSILEVTNLSNGYSVTVLSDDCHYGYSRFDLSSAAFGAIQPYYMGVAYVDVVVLRWGY